METQQQINEIKDQLNRIECATQIAAKNVLTIDDVAMMTGFKKATIYDMTSRNKIPFSKTGGRLFFSKSEIERWLMQNRVATEAELQSQAATYIAKRRI